MAEPLRDKLVEIDLERKAGKIRNGMVRPSGVLRFFYPCDVRSACEFFLRYKDNPELLVMKHPEFREELKGLGLNVELLESISDSDSEMWFLTRTYTAFKHFDWHKYNEWLFRLAFKDVFDGEKDELGENE